MDAAKKAVEVKQPLRRLGRGLSSLMALDTPVRIEVPVAQPKTATVVTTQTIVPTPTTPGLSDFQSIAVSAMSVSRFQPRKTMDEAAIARWPTRSRGRGDAAGDCALLRVGRGRYELVAGEPPVACGSGGGADRDTGVGA